MDPADERPDRPLCGVISRRALLAGLGFMAAAPLLAACGGTAPSAPAPPSSSSSAVSSASSPSTASSTATSSAAKASAGGGRPFVFAAGTDAQKLDAPQSNTQEDYIVNGNIYDGLVRFKAGTTEVVPALAEKWDISPDGLTYTFQLRKGVKFHDGSPMTAEAVAYSFSRFHDKKHPYYKEGMFPNASGYFSNVVDKVEAVGESALKLTLKRPYSPLISNLAIPPMGIVSMEAIKKYEGDIPAHPTGAGPYRFVKRVQDDYVELEANPDYWAGKPKIDRVVFKAIKEDTVRVLSLEKGEIDVAWALDPKNMNRLRSGADTTIMEQPGLNMSWGNFQTEHEVFKSKQVRQGLNWAINRDELARAFYSGAMIPATTPLPPSSWAFDNSIKGYGFDPEKAKTLLKEGGYTGQKITLWTYTVPRGYNPKGEQLATAIQQYWKNVGVDSEIKTMEWATYLNWRHKGEFDFCMGGWMADTGDPDNFLYVLLHSENKGSNNQSWYSNPDYDKAVVAAARETDLEKRKAFYSQAQKIVVEDAPWLFIGSMKDWVGLRKSVQGFKMNPNYTYYIDAVTAV